MVKRIAAITFISLCTTAAWLVLGTTIFTRSDSFRDSLGGRVESNWGAPQQQQPPSATYKQTVPRTSESIQNGKKEIRTVMEEVLTNLPIESTRVQVAFDLEHRQKGLLWYSTYKVAFTGTYTFRNTSNQNQTAVFTLQFPASQAIYDDLAFSANGQALSPINDKTSASASAQVAAGQPAVFTVSYKSQGLDNWRYDLGGEVAQVRDFQLRMTTNFKDIDFPENSLSPTDKQQTAQGWDLTWSYKNLVTGFQIAMTMPQKLQPGPLAGQISFFAPVSLFFFFFLMFMITTIRGIDLHPMNYFFLAAAFFAFHLLLAYLVDHISIHSAFLICSAVSIFLVISYLRLVMGMRFAAIEAGLTQFIYLVLFSYAFFWKGFTGLAITTGSILTLFVVMQLTGRIRWSEKFTPKQIPLAPKQAQHE